MLRDRRSELGQAAIELVAVVPLLLAVLLAVAQLAVAGYALWTAGEAAGAGARAAHVGGDADAAARSALPRWLEDQARIDTGGPISVSVGAPALLPGVPEVRVEAQAELDPGVGSGG